MELYIEGWKDEDDCQSAVSQKEQMTTLLGLFQPLIMRLQKQINKIEIGFCIVN
jgi:hypothetical protein